MPIPVGLPQDLACSRGGERTFQLDSVLLTTFPVGLMVLAAACGCALAQSQPKKADPGRHALLVGCTCYPSLEEHLQLEGPGNDVALMRRLLIDHYQFPPESIVTLAEESLGGQKLPTRDNIKGEFDRLAKVARTGDEVVILLSGHGSQQPDDNPPEEPDGLDETFLPRDVGKWSDNTKVVERAIIDDELGVWLNAIREKGASVWLIVDSCHSGTITRGNDVEKLRQVKPEDLGVPPDALSKAEQAAREERSRGMPDQASIKLPGGASGLVAISAAQAGEPAPELPLPWATRIDTIMACSPTPSVRSWPRPQQATNLGARP